MATTDRNGSGDATTVANPSSQERQFLAQFVDFYWDDVAVDVRTASTLEEKIAALEHAQTLVDLLRVSDGEGELELTPAIVAALAKYRADVVQTITADLSNMDKLRAGDMGWCHIDKTPAETLASSAEALKEYVDEIAACDSILTKVSR